MSDFHALPPFLRSDLFEHIGRMFAYAEIHGHIELANRAAALSEALGEFFREPAEMDAETFAGIFNGCIAIWETCCGEAQGEPWEPADFARLREAALAMHRPLEGAAVH